MTAEAWQRKLHWNATGHGWFARTDELRIFVSEKTYEKHLKAYLAREGIELKTLTEIMRPAEEAWRRQCEIIDRFQKNLDYWKTCKDIGVMISPLSPVK